MTEDKANISNSVKDCFRFTFWYTNSYMQAYIFPSNIKRYVDFILVTR